MSDEKRVEDGVVLATPAASLSRATGLPPEQHRRCRCFLTHVPALAPSTSLLLLIDWY